MLPLILCAEEFAPSMVCFHPVTGYLSRASLAEGKRGITFNRNNAFTDRPMQVACGRCVGCRLDRSRNWAIRCVHEASMYENNCFITLTYAPEHLPSDGSLHLDHFQKFMKKLRRRFGSGVRYYMCGEYGEKFSRPHYHACLFNFDFPDKILYKKSHGLPLYTSKILDDIWGLGFCTIGTLTFESAAYVARYVLKKAFGTVADRHYLDTSTGVYRTPEFTTMSRRPGIGSTWFQKYKSDVFPHDHVVHDAFPLKPPRFYDRALEKSDPETFEKIKNKRVRDAIKNLDNSTPERLAVREQVKLAQLTRLTRKFEGK
jgi:hypothetical protein